MVTVKHEVPVVRHGVAQGTLPRNIARSQNVDLVNQWSRLEKLIQEKLAQGAIEKHSTAQTQDYQLQLELLELQNQKRTVARKIDEAWSIHVKGASGSVAEQDQYVNSLPPSAQGQGYMLPRTQINHVQVQDQVSDRAADAKALGSDSRMSATPAPSSDANDESSDDDEQYKSAGGDLRSSEHDRFLHDHEKMMDETLTSCEPMFSPHPFVSGPSNCLPDYEKQLRVLNEQIKHNETVLHDAGTLDYQIQLTLVTQQNQKQLLMARQSQEQDSQLPMQDQKQFRNQDYQMQLMILEQQNKRRLMMVRQEQDAQMQDHTQAPKRVQGVQDCCGGENVLLEKKNKEILIRARQEQDRMLPPRVHANLEQKQDLERESEQDSERELQNYAMQVMLQDQQSKKRLRLFHEEQDQMAAAQSHGNQEQEQGSEQEQGHVTTGHNFSPQYYYQPEHLQRQDKDGEAKASQGPVSSGYAGGAPNHALQDYNMQLDLLDQQHQKRKAKAAQEQSASAVAAGAADQFLLESSGQEHEARPAALQDYKTQLNILARQSLERQGVLNGQQGASAEPGRNYLLEDYQHQLKLLDERGETRIKMTDLRQEIAAHGGNHALQNYQTQIRQIEQEIQGRKGKAVEGRDPSTAGGFRYYNPQEHQMQAQPMQAPVLQPYQEQLMLLEQQNKKRRLAEQQAPSMVDPEPQLMDHNLQLQMLDQQNKERQIHATQPIRLEAKRKIIRERQERATSSVAKDRQMGEPWTFSRMSVCAPPPPENSQIHQHLGNDRSTTEVSKPHPYLPERMAEEEYQRELELLQQQCCKRMKLARAEYAKTAAQPSPPPPSAEPHWSENYQTQMSILEDANEKARMARQQPAEVKVESIEGQGVWTPESSAVPSTPGVIFTPQSSVVAQTPELVGVGAEGRPLVLRIVGQE